MITNRFHATRDSYQIPAAVVAGGGGIALGRGVDMTDPQNPILIPDLSRFFAETLMVRGVDPGYEVSGDVIKDTFALLQSDSLESEAVTLNTYFRASYSLSSVGAALEHARSSRQDSHSAYVLLTHRGDSRVMSPGLFHVRDDLRPVAEGIDDDETAFTQFRRDFGTHYIHGLTYGLTIAIRGKTRSKDQDERDKLGARLKLGFGAFKGEGGVDAETKKHLQSSDLELTSEVNCGGTIPARPLVMSSFEEIAKFLKDLGAGQVRFKLAPVELHLASYWSLLDPARLPRCRSLLDPVRFGTAFSPPRGTFGVPAGTVIAWRPTPAHIENAADPAHAVIHPPEGWALCDGQEGRPDLRGRFVRGARDIGGVCETGGSESHDHKLVSGKVARIAGLVTASTSALTGAEKPALPHLPPFVQLVYIVKLDETH